MLALNPHTLHAATACFRLGGTSADALLARADAALRTGPWSVMDKRIVPPSGDKHDFMSLGTYWWPDPNSTDGLPYIRRDGQTNPEIEQLDRPRLSLMANAVALLAATTHLSGEQAYADHAVRLLHAWFLDPATRMNPHLRYGQGIPGRCIGRCIGIIDTECLARVCDAIVLLRGQPPFTAEMDRGLDAWFNEYLNWLLNDPLGVAEAAEGNNHGTCYDVQVVALAVHLGRMETARQILAAVPQRRIYAQITQDGRMPLELARTKAWSYSLKNLMALINLAHWGRRFDLPIWESRNAEGCCIQAAIDWLLPFALGRQVWQYQELGGMHGESLIPALIHANQLEEADRYAAGMQEMGVNIGTACLQVMAGCPLGAVGTIAGRRGFHN